MVEGEVTAYADPSAPSSRTSTIARAWPSGAVTTAIALLAASATALGYGARQEPAVPDAPVDAA